MPAAPIARAASVVGAAGVVVGALLPWIISGETTRNSFTTVRTARNLELVDNGLANAVLAGWFLVPVVASLVLLLAVLGRRRSLAVASLGLGIVATLFAAFVRLSPIATSVGPPVTIGAGLVLLIAAAVLLRSRTGEGPGAPGDAPNATPSSDASPVP
jgi:hypothetical protein